MLFVLLNPGILGAAYDYSALVIGLWNLPFSFGTIIGSVIGGAAVDRGLQKFGRGGRLISANFSTFLLSVGLIGYGWTVQWSSFLGMFFSFFIGFGVCANRLVFFLCFFKFFLMLIFNRPGYLSYAMQENPSNAAAVTGATMFFSMLVVSTLLLFF